MSDYNECDHVFVYTGDHDHLEDWEGRFLWRYMVCVLCHTETVEEQLVEDYSHFSWDEEDPDSM